MRKIIGVEYEGSQAHVTLLREDVRCIITVQEQGIVIMTVSDWASDESWTYHVTLDEFYEFMRGRNETQPREI